MRIVPGTAWRLPEFLTGDFPGWIAVAVGVAVLVIAYKALRRPLTQLIFGHALSIEYDQTEKSATVTARAVIVSLATSFIWDVVSCRIKIGEEETS